MVPALVTTAGLWRELILHDPLFPFLKVAAVSPNARFPGSTVSTIRVAPIKIYQAKWVGQKMSPDIGPACGGDAILPPGHFR
jgi:hypothetical protein